MLLNQLEPVEGDERRRSAKSLHHRVPAQDRGLRQPRPTPGPHGRAGHRQGPYVPGGRTRHRVRVRRQHPGSVRQHPRPSTGGCSKRSAYVGSTNRMFLPPYIALADPDLAVRELELVMAAGATIIQTKSGHAHGGRTTRSVVGPLLTPSTTVSGRSSMTPRSAWRYISGGTDYQKGGSDWSEDPETVFGDFDAFQWVMYWGDRPAHGAHCRTLILAQLLRPLPQHQGLPLGDGNRLAPLYPPQDGSCVLDGPQGRSGSDPGRLDQRPSEIFRQHFIVAPYPEENVRRIVDEIGIDPIVFGSDFPTARASPTRPGTSTPNCPASAWTSNAGSARQPGELPQDRFLTRLRFQNRGSRMFRQ